MMVRRTKRKTKPGRGIHANSKDAPSSRPGYFTAYTPLERHCDSCIHYRHSDGGLWGDWGADPPYHECKYLEAAPRRIARRVARYFGWGYADGCPGYIGMDDRDGEE